MRAVVNLDGRILPAGEAKISLFDHGFLFGEGIYETLRTCNRRILFYDRHMRRFRTSAAMIGLSIPIDDMELRRRLVATIAAAGLGADEEAYGRILLTRGVGDLTYDPAACPVPTLALIVKPLVEPTPEMIASGVRVALVSVIRNHPASVNPLIKSNNLLNNVLAMHEAIRQGASEALMRNYRGEIAECSQSNFFIVRGGRAETPPLTAGLLAGVTRDFLFEVGAAAGIPVREASLRDEDVFAADEAFLTSTTRQVLPAVRVGDRPIGDGRPGPITLRLREQFRRMAGELANQVDSR